MGAGTVPSLQQCIVVLALAKGFYKAIRCWVGGVPRPSNIEAL